MGWTTASIAAAGLRAMRDPGPLPPSPSFLSPLMLGNLQPAGLPGFPGGVTHAFILEESEPLSMSPFTTRTGKGTA